MVVTTRRKSAAEKPNKGKGAASTETNNESIEPEEAPEGSSSSGSRRPATRTRNISPPPAPSDTAPSVVKRGRGRTHKEKQEEPVPAQVPEEDTTSAASPEVEANEVDSEPVAVEAVEVVVQEIDEQPTAAGVEVDIQDDCSGSNIEGAVEQNVAEPEVLAAPKQRFDYEFMGPCGTAVLILTMPLVVLGLYLACNEQHCMGISDVEAFISASKSALSSLTKEQLSNDVAAFGGRITQWFNDASTQANLLTSLKIFGSWMLFQVVLERLLPGEVREGVVLKNGSRLKYNLNGHLAFWASWLILGHVFPQLDGEYNFLGFGGFQFSKLYDVYFELAFVACGFSLLLSFLLYIASFRPGAQLAAPGSSGNHIYDLFMGRELNPRIGSFDLKYFCELRPGLMGWVALDIGMLCKQYAVRGHVSLPMMVVVCTQALYVWDALYNEKSILTTMDITSDGFGFMLAFGDLAWVPFIYSLQARYLVNHTTDLPAWYYAAMLALFVLGYTIFRGANSQKDAFRSNPNAPEVAHLRKMETQRGTTLLISGWWGFARKINYTGDYLMALSWCLSCGFDNAIPYFFGIYFFILLVHRALRDDHACAIKYGDDWKAYKAAVPHMFIPGVV